MEIREELNQRHEIAQKLVSEIEWYYEREGVMIELEELENRIAEEMQQEEWTEKAIEFMLEISEDIHEVESLIIIDSINNMNCQNEGNGISFFDRY